MQQIWPNNKSFAFTIFDDTDNAKLEDVKLVYDFLLSLGIRTTKSVWVNEPENKPRIGGANLSDPDYCDYVKQLHDRGVEIGLHNVSADHNTREKTEIGFERFREIFGQYPTSFANHADNKENIYWGSKRLSGVFRAVYSKFSAQRSFSGEDKNSPYFWGDMSKERIRYTRNFVFKEVNTAIADPYTPYTDKAKPFINNWFSSANGSVLSVFNKNITKSAIDKLEKEGGYCIVYTHFCSFVKDGRLDPTFVSTMEYLSSRPGWFVPVTDLLDYLADKKGITDLKGIKKFRLEGRWLREQILTRLFK